MEGGLPNKGLQAMIGSDPFHLISLVLLILVSFDLVLDYSSNCVCTLQPSGLLSPN